MGRNRSKYTGKLQTRGQINATRTRTKRTKENKVINEFTSTVGGSLTNDTNRGSGKRPRTVTVTLPGVQGRGYYGAAEIWATKIQGGIDRATKSGAVKNVPVSGVPGAGFNLPEEEQRRSVCAILIKRYKADDKRLLDLYQRIRKAQLTSKQIVFAIGVLEERGFIKQGVFK